MLGAPVGAGSGVVAQAAEHDDVEGVVGSAVTAAVEAVTVGPTAADRERSGPAKVRERSLGAQPVGVVSGGDEQLPGDFGADTN